MHLPDVIWNFFRHLPWPERARCKMKVFPMFLFPLIIYFIIWSLMELAGNGSRFLSEKNSESAIRICLFIYKILGINYEFSVTKFIRSISYFCDKKYVHFFVHHKTCVIQVILSARRALLYLVFFSSSSSSFSFSPFSSISNFFISSSSSTSQIQTFRLP